MKRATLLKVLATALVVVMVASAFPLAQVLLDQVDSSRSGANSSSGSSNGTGSSANADRLPFGPADAPDALAGLAGTGATGGTSSRPWSPGAGVEHSTGSAVLDEVIGAASAMGYQVTLPDLPLDQLASVNPLRPAILTWMQVTNSQVAPNELARELARADALPQSLQRDLAIVVLSAAKATLLQQQALGLISPEDLQWIRAHPELASDLANGVVTPDTMRLASLAARVDVQKSIEASLLILEAVEATRGSLSDPSAAKTVDALSLGTLDPTAESILSLLTTSTSGMSDAQKVRFAAQIISTSAGITMPAALPNVTFAAAVERLIGATGQKPDAAAIQDALDTAAKLPEDLQLALAKPILAQALAVEAAMFPTPATQSQALVGVLHAIADALPTLEKYHLYWRSSPEALRIAQWAPSARVGWALEHAGMIRSTQGDLVDLVRAGGILHGIPLQDAVVPDRSFTDAFIALAGERGFAPNATEIEEVRAAGDTLAPEVRAAAARMMSGAAEAARLHRLAFSALSSDERFFLLTAGAPTDLFTKKDITDAELATLTRIVQLSERVDLAKLSAAEIVGVRATLDARDLLTPKLQTQGVDARSYSWVDALSKLLPWTTARAQPAPECGVDPIGIVQTGCSNDVLIRISMPFRFSLETNGDIDDENTELLVITGPGSSNIGPEEKQIFFEGTRPAFGAATVFIDLDGGDTYNRPVAMTYPTQLVPVSLHLDMGGADYYTDPSNLYDAKTGAYQLGFFGRSEGMPTQASAIGGGVAVLIDATGNDRYEAPNFSQGYGQWGLGLLADLAGNDLFVGGRYSQGASGRDLNAGVGILADVAGDDQYSAKSGQGFGLGGILLDVAGRDSYSNQKPAIGTPIVRLTVLPGDNLTTLNERADNLVWLDGPADLNLGLGVDAEISATPTDDDNDLFNNFVEYLAGTDPKDSASTPVTKPTERSALVVQDSDQDTFPDYVERALSTDPNSAASYPAGFPRGPTFVIPLVGTITLGESTDGLIQNQPTKQDKIIDLRLPLQNAGSINYACLGPGGNSNTGPSSANTALNLTYAPFYTGIMDSNTVPGDVGTFHPNQTRPTPQAPCVLLGYSSDAPGNGTGTLPEVTGLDGTGGTSTTPGDESTSKFNNFTFRLPAGILAIGDSVTTNYDVDYFFVLDIGGNDKFANRAGGALPVQTARPASGPADDAGVTSNGQSGSTTGVGAGTAPRNMIFLAPSIVLNVDLAKNGEVPTPDPFGARVYSENNSMGHDAYRAPDKGDFAQGSLLGVLIDTAGNDEYVAGAGSQGSLGGVLLDLAGNDFYLAKDLSQGAGLASVVPAKGAEGVPAVPSDSVQRGTQAPMNDATFRGLIPGLLADLGEGKDDYRAGNHSQGFARGFVDSGSSILGLGILLDDGGDDAYDTARQFGLNSQGVGHQHGIGILVDVDGSDLYTAYGIVSHGATLSQSYMAPGGDRTRSGAGILVDLASPGDGYYYYDRNGEHVRTTERQNNLTLTRGDIQSGDAHLMLAPGIHYDGEGVNASAIFHAGGREIVGAPAGADGSVDTNAFFVDLPAARLAIGNGGDTKYAYEYALVIDVGGVNTYNMNAGGFVPDILLRSDASNALSNPLHPALSMFPVSLVYDAGTTGSLYSASQGLVQGAAFFSVGVLADLGGNDTFVVKPSLVPGSGMGWATTSPVIDGAISASEWKFSEARQLVLTDENDSRFTEPLTLRVANDERNVYLAIQSHTASKRDTAPRTYDNVMVELNGGRVNTTWDAARGFTNVDTSLIFIHDCRAYDGHFAADFSHIRDTVNDVRAACSVADDGTFSIELAKPLREGYPRDPNDLALQYDEELGYLVKELGIRIAFNQSVTGDMFSWPAQSRDQDGRGSYRTDGTLAEEMADWGAFGMANLGVDGKAVNLTRAPSVSQGAALGGGVGILAQLGTISSPATLTALDHAQGYGGYGGLGFLLDVGSSDKYAATTFAQGASEVRGLGILLDADGNDNYVSQGNALGYTAGGVSLFIDLHGDDEYAINGADTRPIFRQATVLGLLDQWSFSQSGVGLDYLSNDDVRSSVWGPTATLLWKAQRTELKVETVDDEGRCSHNPAAEVVTGRVCLAAEIDLSTGPGSQAAGTLSVDAVDFLGNGRRFATTSVPDIAGTTKPRFTAIMNASLLPDGVLNFTAVAQLRLTTAERGVILFTDRYSEGNPGASKRVLVNNPAKSVICTSPKLNVEPEFRNGLECLSQAPAIFSPLALEGAFTAADIKWGVSHDAGEDRLALKQKWVPPAYDRNFPCEDDASELCNFVPLYFRAPGTDEEWSTTEPNYPPFSPSETIQERSHDTPFSQKSRVLNDNLTIYADDAFHVYMDNRTPFLQGNYSTFVTITLLDSQRNPVVHEGKEVILAKQDFVSFRGLAPLNEGLSAAYNNSVRPAVNQQLNALGDRFNGPNQGVVKGAMATVYSLCASPTLTLGCDQLRGDVGATVVNNEVRTCRNVAPWNLLARQDRPLCSPSGFDQLNDTAADADAGVGPSVRDAADTVIENDNLFPGNRPDNWSHLFLDANTAFAPGTPGVSANPDGTITIQKGYGFSIAIYSDSDTLLQNIADNLTDVRGIYNDNVRDPLFRTEKTIIEALRENETYQQQCSTQRAACDFLELLITGTVYNTVNGPVNGLSENQLNGTVAHPPIPIATWHLNGGSRLDLRVPSEGHTSATLAIDRIATNETVRTLFDGVIAGDIEGGATRDGRIDIGGHSLWSARSGLRFTQHVTPFDGANDAGDLLPDGLYRARLVAGDDSNRITNTTIQTILLDKTPPTSQLQTRGYAGLATLSGGKGLPLQWTVDETGAGLERVWVYRWLGSGDLSDPSSWDIMSEPAGYPAGVNIGYDTNRVSTRSDYYYVTIAKDRAGNYEFQNRVRDLVADGSIDPSGKSYHYQAFLAKLRDGVTTLVVVDTGSPIQLSPPTIDGGKLVYFQGTDTAFVRAGAPFKASVCVSDPENGVDRVSFVFDYVSATTGAVMSHMFGGATKGACGSGGAGTRYEYDGWGALNTNKTTFPDGPWSLTADVFDLAGNRIQLPVTNVVLDSQAPVVRLESPVYPPGQAAVKPGDRVTLRVFAEDAYGVNDLAIRVDASSLSTQGLVGTVARRIDGVVYQEATFTVDLPTVANGIYEIPVTVPDNAGNVFPGKFFVVVDFKKFTIDPASVTVSNVTHNSVVLKWRTSEPTTSLARFGTSMLDLKQRTPTNSTLVTNHTLLVEGLQPSTNYYFRAVSSTAGGYTNESEFLDALTTTALFLDPYAPAAGSSLSGPVEVRFHGGLHDSTGFVTYTLDVRASEDSAWSFVTTLTEQGDEHALVFNSSRYLDGPGYSLRVTAASGKDVVTKVIGPFLTDNTAPELTIFSPLVATNDTTPLIRAEARDNLALFGSEPATLTIDGIPVEGNLAIEPSGQAVNVRYDVPSALASGPHTLVLKVKDLAGNVATQTWKVTIDGDAPLVRVEPTRYSPGPAAAKIGGAVTLNLTITDASGVSSVIAQTGGIATEPTTTLTRVVGTDRFVGTFTVTARDDSAVKRVIITATDLAGNAREAGVDVVIDNAKPAVSEPQVSEVTQTRGVIGVTSSEPITLVGTASAPNSPLVTAATTELTSRPLITFAGLLPSRTYAFTLQALDRAGNSVELIGKFQTDADLKAPTRIATVNVLDLLNGTLRLSWSQASDDVGVDFYRVYRSDDGVNFRPLAEVKGTTMDDRNLPLEKAFVYQIVAVDYGGNEGPISDSLRAAATAVPRLSGGFATPSVGSTATVFQYSITYVSPGGVTPTFVRVILDGVSQEMRLKANGVYVYETRLAPHERDHPHTYSFEASDGRYTVHFPEDGSVLRGPLVSADALAGESGGVGFAARVPLLGAVGTTLALVAAVAAVVILRRRESK